MKLKRKLTASQMDEYVKSLVRIALDDSHHAANEAFRKIVADNDLRTWEATVIATKFQQELREAIKKEPKL